MSLEQTLSEFEKKAVAAAPIGGTLKFLVDGNSVIIDGTGDSNTIKVDDTEADCTITVSSDVLKQLQSGDINPMMAVMGGKIKIAGDMGLAMKVQSLM